MCVAKNTLETVLRNRFLWIVVWSITLVVALSLGVYLPHKSTNDDMNNALLNNTQQNIAFMRQEGIRFASQTFDLKSQTVQFINQWKVDEQRSVWPYSKSQWNTWLTWQDDRVLTNAQRLYPDQPPTSNPYVTYGHGTYHVPFQTTKDIHNFSSLVNATLSKTFFADEFFKNPWVLGDRKTIVSLYSCYDNTGLSVEFPGTQIELVADQINYDCRDDDWYSAVPLNEIGMTGSYVDAYAESLLVSIVKKDQTTASGMDIRLQNLHALMDTLISLGPQYDQFKTVTVWARTQNNAWNKLTGGLTLLDTTTFASLPSDAVSLYGVSANTLYVQVHVDDAFVRLLTTDINQRTKDNVTYTIIIVLCVVVLVLVAVLIGIECVKRRCIRSLKLTSEHIRFAPSHHIGIFQQSHVFPSADHDTGGLVECHALSSYVNDVVLPAYKQSRVFSGRGSIAVPQYAAFEINDDVKQGKQEEKQQEKQQQSQKQKQNKSTPTPTITTINVVVTLVLFIMLAIVYITMFSLSKAVYDTNHRDFQNLLWSNAQTTLLLSSVSLTQNIQGFFSNLEQTTTVLGQYASAAITNVNGTSIPIYSALSAQENYMEIPKDDNDLALFGFHFCNASIASKDQLLKTPGVNETAHLVYPFRAVLSSNSDITQCYVGLSNGLIFWVQTDQQYADDYKDGTFLDSTTNTYVHGYSPVLDPWYQSGLISASPGFTVPYWDPSEGLLTITNYIKTTIDPRLDAVLACDLNMTQMIANVNASHLTQDAISFLFDSTRKTIFIHTLLDPSTPQSVKLNVVEPEVNDWFFSLNVSSSKANYTSTILERHGILYFIVCRPIVLTQQTLTFCEMIPQSSILVASESMERAWKHAFTIGVVILVIVFPVWIGIISCWNQKLATDASNTLINSQKTLEGAVVLSQRDDSVLYQFSNYPSEKNKALDAFMSSLPLPDDVCVIQLESLTMSMAFVTNILTGRISNATADTWKTLFDVFNTHVDHIDRIIAPAGLPSLHVLLTRGLHRMQLVNYQQMLWLQIKFGVFNNILILHRFSQAVQRFSACIEASLYKVDDYRIMGDCWKVMGAFYKAQKQFQEAEDAWDWALQWYIKIIPEDHSERMKSAFAISVHLFSLSLIRKATRLQVEKRLNQAMMFFYQNHIRNNMPIQNQEYEIEMKLNSILYRLEYDVDMHLVPAELQVLETRAMTPLLQTAFVQLKKKYAQRHERTAKRIILMLDVSGSMQGPKMIALQTGVKHLIRALAMPYTLTMCTFSDDVRIDLRAFHVRNADDIRIADTAVDQMIVRGGTNLYEAISTCLQMINALSSQSALPPPLYDEKKEVKMDGGGKQNETRYEDFVFLLTDGYHVAKTEADAMIAAEAVEKQILQSVRGHPTIWKYYTVRAKNEIPHDKIAEISAQKLPLWFAQLGGTHKDIELINVEHPDVGVREAFNDMETILQTNNIIDCSSL